MWCRCAARVCRSQPSRCCIQSKFDVVHGECMRQGWCPQIAPRGPSRAVLSAAVDGWMWTSRVVSKSDGMASENDEQGMEVGKVGDPSLTLEVGIRAHGAQPGWGWVGPGGARGVLGGGWAWLGTSGDRGCPRVLHTLGPCLLLRDCLQKQHQNRLRPLYTIYTFFLTTFIIRYQNIQLTVADIPLS